MRLPKWGEELCGSHTDNNKQQLIISKMFRGERKIYNVGKWLLVQDTIKCYLLLK